MAIMVVKIYGGSTYGDDDGEVNKINDDKFHEANNGSEEYDTVADDNCYSNENNGDNIDKSAVIFTTIKTNYFIVCEDADSHYH